MGEAVIWGVLVAGLAAVVMRLFGREDAASTGRAPLRDVHPYHCVAIQSSAGACAVAQKLQGQRFLADEAPQLPLRGCSSLNCACVYTHFEDRRHHMRRDPYVHKTYDIKPLSAERRVSRGRRKTDVQYHPAN